MDYRLMLIRRTGWQWPLGYGDRLELWDTQEIRVQVEIPALVNLLLAKALEADFVKILLMEGTPHQPRVSGGSSSPGRRAVSASSRAGSTPPSP